jgi:hypothetical protein
VVVRPASSGSESDETMVVRDAGAVSATKAGSDSGAVSATKIVDETRSGAGDEPDGDDEDEETPIEVLEDLTGNRARAADDDTPPQVGGKP